MLNQARNERMAETGPSFTPRVIRQLPTVPPHKARVLLVCDSAAGTDKLQSALKFGAVEIVCVGDSDELSLVSEGGYALVVIDMAPVKLLEVLKTTRASEALAELPVFVEASRIVAEASLAGLLPRYRAMPCSYSELAALTRQRLAPAQRSIREEIFL